jgi:hypothetical protein
VEAELGLAKRWAAKKPVRRSAGGGDARFISKRRPLTCRGRDDRVGDDSEVVFLPAHHDKPKSRAFSPWILARNTPLAGFKDSLFELFTRQLNEKKEAVG